MTRLTQLKNTYRWAQERFLDCLDKRTNDVLVEARRIYYNAFNDEFKALPEGVGVVNCPNDDNIFFVRLDGRLWWHCSSCGAHLPVVKEPLQEKPV